MNGRDLYRCVIGFGLLAGMFAVVVGLTGEISSWAWPIAIFGLIGNTILIAVEILR